MSLSFNFGKKKGRQSSTSVLDKSVNASEQQTGSTSGQSTQTQQQNSTEKAIQDILQSTKQNQSNTGSQTGTTSVSGSTTQQQNQNQQALTTLLGADVQQSLTDKILGLLGDSSTVSGAQDLIDILSGNALSGSEDIAAANASIVESARYTGEKELQSLQTQLAQQAGGSIANTGVVAATAEGRASLEAQLAGLEGQLALDARQTQTQELVAALGGTQGETDQASSLLNILKGATQQQTESASTVASGSQKQTQQQDIQTLSQIISDSISQTKGETTTTSLSDLLSSATTEQQTELTKLLEEITKATERTKGKSSGSEFSLGGTTAKPTT